MAAKNETLETILKELENIGARMNKLEHYVGISKDRMLCPGCGTDLMPTMHSRPQQFTSWAQAGVAVPLCGKCIRDMNHLQHKLVGVLKYVAQDGGKQEAERG